MRYYVSLHPLEGTPERLLRADADGRVSVWWDDDWQETPLMQAQLDGLGGDSHYRLARREDVAELKRRLAGSPSDSESR